jgi:hypothetical protein
MVKLKKKQLIKRTKKQLQIRASLSNPATQII